MQLSLLINKPILTQSETNIFFFKKINYTFASKSMKHAVASSVTQGRDLCGGGVGGGGGGGGGMRERGRERETEGRVSNLVFYAQSTITVI